MKKYLILLLTLFALNSCEQDDEIIDLDAYKKGQKVFVCHKGEAISISQNALKAHLDHGDAEGSCDVGENEVLIQGTVELPKSIKPKSLSVVSNYGTFELDARGNFTAIANKLSKNILFVENENGDILLAKLITEGSSFETINFETTAEVIVALMPWTAFVEDDDLKLILNEIAQSNDFSALIDAFEASLENGISPLDDSNVLLALEAVISNVLGVVSKEEGIAFKIPEVDNFVEPIITYESGNLVINNNGTTTAVWGVEVSKDSESISGELVLPPNTLRFPSLSKIGDFVKGDFNSTFFEKGLPLQIPIQIEDKYSLSFKSPTSPYLFESKLARTAAYSNLSIINFAMLKALGFKNVSTYGLDTGCNKNFFDGLIESIIEGIIETKGLPSASWYLDKLGETLANIAEDTVNCGFKINGKDSSKYLGLLGKYFDVYSKLQTSVILVNLFTDMLLLQDIDICRVLVDGKIYPCFSLEKYKFVKDQEYPIDEEIELQVLASFDQVLDENDVSLAGVKVNWEVIEGEGLFNSNQTQTSNKGIAKVNYAPTVEGAQLIRASIQGKDKNLIHEVQFSLNVMEDDENEKGLSLESLDGNLNFGDVIINTQSEKLLSITNKSETDAITVSSIYLPDGYNVDWNGGVLEPGKSKSVVLTFGPTETTTYNGQITVESNDFEPVSLNLLGNGIEERNGYKIELYNPVSKEVYLTFYEGDKITLPNYTQHWYLLSRDGEFLTDYDYWGGSIRFKSGDALNSNDITVNDYEFEVFDPNIGNVTIKVDVTLENKLRSRIFGKTFTRININAPNYPQRITEIYGDGTYKSYWHYTSEEIPDRDITTGTLTGDNMQTYCHVSEDERYISFEYCIGEAGGALILEDGQYKSNDIRYRVEVKTN